MKKKTAKWLVPVLVAWLLGGYILSPGPVFGLMQGLGILDTSYPLFKVFYAPLIWLSDSVDWIEDFYEWWVMLWIGQFS